MQAVLGQPVTVAWGFERVRGTIKGFFGPAGHRMAEVAVDLGDRDSVTVSVPVDILADETRPDEPLE